MVSARYDKVDALFCHDDIDKHSDETLLNCPHNSRNRPQLTIFVSHERREERKEKHTSERCSLRLCGCAYLRAIAYDTEHVKLLLVNDIPDPVEFLSHYE